MCWSDTMNKVALVVGAGDATGGAIARRFARAGWMARSQVFYLQRWMETF